VLGRFDEAEPLAEAGKQLSSQHDLAAEMLWRQVSARVYASRGEHATAEELAREAVAIGNRTDALNHLGEAHADLAEVLVLAGKRDDAVGALEQVLERYERKQNLVTAERVRARLAEVQFSDTAAERA
jgi:tetratricopeptide (TPR) repeat protein